MRFLAVLALLLIALLSACSESPTEPAGPSLGQPFSLGVGESATIGGQQITIRFEQLVSDGRCPMDALCVWPGEAVVALSFELRNRPAAFQLSTLLTPGTTISGYRIALRAVSPFPRSNVRIDPGDYRVELLVTQ